MIVYSGRDLELFLSEANDKHYKKRFIYRDLMDYLDGTNGQNGKVCCLYGLRRTGKTVMMHQAMRKIGDYNDILLIHCENDEDAKSYDTMGMVRKQIKEHPGCRYIFIDEITKTRNFVGTASFLANDYAVSGKKIVVAGTDSFGFFLAKNDELLDRMYQIHTTYISYKEYHFCLGKDIMDYIKYGGTLTDGSVFYNKDSFKEYLNSSIAYNITHGLEKWNQGRNFGILEEIVAHGDLPSFINKVVEYHNRTFLASVINKAFKSNDLGSLIDLMTKHDTADTTYLESAELNEVVRMVLGIKGEFFHPADAECVDRIIEYLIALDVLFKVPDNPFGKNEYIFTQVGIRYWQADALIEALMMSDEFTKNYNDAEKYDITKKIREDVCGGILEDIVFYQLYASLKDRPEIKVAKYRNVQGQEVDVLIENLDAKTSVAIEVKLSDQKHANQFRHLANEEFCREIEKKTGTRISNKVVVYRGETAPSGIPGICYINVEQLLKYPERYTEVLLRENAFNVIENKTLSGEEQSKEENGARSAKRVTEPNQSLGLCSGEEDVLDILNACADDGLGLGGDCSLCVGESTHKLHGFRTAADETTEVLKEGIDLESP